MHGSDDTGFQEALMNLAFVRGGFGSDGDTRFVRERIAMLAWFPGAASVLILAINAGSWIVGAVGTVLLLVGLWLFTYRGDQVAAFVRGRLRRTPAGP